MRKIIMFIAVFGLTCPLYAFESRLIGSWGLVKDDEKEVFVTFSRDTISLYGTEFGAHEYETAADTIYIGQDDGSMMIQYYLLAPNKLLFIMSYDEFSSSLILILTKI